MTDVYHGTQIYVERTGFSWSQDTNGDFIIFVNKFINTSRASYDSVYTGFWYDFDIPSSAYSDDMAGYISAVNLCYMYDGGSYTQKVGICFLEPSGAHGAHWYNYATTPGDDNSYYAALGDVNVSASWPTTPADYKIMINCGPYVFGPEDTITIAYGVVAGNDESELTLAATRMIQLYDSLNLSVEEDPIAQIPESKEISLTAGFFNGRISAVLNMPCDDYVKISVFDVHGREVLGSARFNATHGENTFFLDAGSLSNGLYFVRVSSASVCAVGKVSVIR